MRAMHSQFQRFFEYLSVQKLRTPKGLDWIRGQYPSLSQIELMIEMQALRTMNCMMTIFSLDSNHCLILTNLEYAKAPDAIDPLEDRQNARYSGQTIARTVSRKK